MVPGDLGGSAETSTERFLETSGVFRTVLESHAGFYRFGRFLVDFGRVLGGHVGGSLEAKTDENWKKHYFCVIF